LPFWSGWIRDNLKRRGTTGDKGKKDREKVLKQKATKQDREVKLGMLGLGIER